MKLQMRNSSIFMLAFLMVLGLGSLSSGQTVIVTPKKVVYKRVKPTTPYRRTFVIIYPRIFGVSPAVKRNIEAVLDYEKVFEFTVKEERTEVEWLEDAGYKVGFNRRGILSVTLTVSGSAAYPSSNVKHLNIDTKTGDKISVVDQIKSGADEAMLARLNGLLKAEVAKYKTLYRNPKYEAGDVDLLFGENVGFTLDNVEDFTVGRRGITFFYDYGFPHAIQALQPPGTFLLRWSELRTYIKDSSVFRQLAR